jgi:hypothetical protein
VAPSIAHAHYVQQIQHRCIKDYHHLQPVQTAESNLPQPYILAALCTNPPDFSVLLSR